MKKEGIYLITLLFITLFSHLAHAQLQGNELYLFPRLLIKVDTQRWATDNYKTFLNSLDGFAELKSKQDPAIILMVKPYTYNLSDRHYDECRCWPDAFGTYTRLQKELQARKMLVDGDTVFISVQKTRENKTIFHIGTCKADPTTCMVRISAVGPATDSVFVKESFLQVHRTIRRVTPAEMDAHFSLPLTDVNYKNGLQRQLAYYNTAGQIQYERDLKGTRDRAYHINSIRDGHHNNYAPVGWMDLPENLESLSTDSLIRMHGFYYYMYDTDRERLKVAPHFFPRGFTFTLLEKSRNDLINGNFLMEDVVRLYAGATWHPGDAFYYEKITNRSTNIPLIHFQKMIQPLLPHYNIVDVNPPSFSADRRQLIFTVFHQANRNQEREKGYVIFTPEGNSFKRELVPPLLVNDKNISLEDLEAPDPFRVRVLKDWGNDFTYQKKRIYLLDHRKDSTFWISYPLPTINSESNYLILYQFDAAYEDHPVINTPRWAKDHPGEHPDEYGNPVEVGVGEDIPKIVDNSKDQRDKLLNAASPKDRLYTYAWYVYDINGDKKKELISFSISNGRMIFYKCYTDTPNGLVLLNDRKTEEQIRKTEAYQKLLKRSLLPVDMPD